MSTKAPTPRFTVITLGVSDMRASIAFYEALGFARKMRATGEAVAFFDTGGYRPDSRRSETRLLRQLGRSSRTQLRSRIMVVA